MAEAPKEPGTRERIVQAAIACIEREGLERASVRKIAQEAGVNVAAINYHFGAKEALIAQVREVTLRSAFQDFIDDLDRTVERGLPMRRALPQVLEEFLGFLVRYPRIGYAHLRDVIVEQDYRTPISRELNRFLEQLLERVAPLAPGLDAGRRRIALAQIWSNVLALGLMPRLTAAFTGLDLSTPQDRRAYVEALLAPLLEA